MIINITNNGEKSTLEALPDSQLCNDCNRHIDIVVGVQVLLPVSVTGITAAAVKTLISLFQMLCSDMLNHMAMLLAVIAAFNADVSNFSFILNEGVYTSPWKK